jgi:hypothetical protein
MMDSGMLIGLKKKEHSYKVIVKKLLTKKELDDEDTEFLKKQGLL